MKYEFISLRDSLKYQYNKINKNFKCHFKLKIMNSLLQKQGWLCQVSKKAYDINWELTQDSKTNMLSFSKKMVENTKQINEYK